MEKELDLTELLKDAPKGTKLYSPIFGECELKEINVDMICVAIKDSCSKIFFEDGSYYGGGECLLFPSRDNRDWSSFKVEKEGFKVGDRVKNKETGEVRILTQKTQQPSGGFLTKRLNCSFDSCEIYISNDMFDKYEKVEKFDPEWLKPFDRVLVRNCYDDNWFASFFSNLIDNKYEDRYVVVDGWCYKSCIPYNEETKHLVGTADEEPEFYKID